MTSDVSILCPGKNLPPGLLLPLQSEDTQRYRTEAFVSRSLEPEDILDYGTFVVALAAWSADETERVSLMPTEQDIDGLHAVGYGLGLRTLRRYGGLRKLQSDLGFYPDGLDPTKEEVTKRLSWLAHVAYSGQQGEQALQEVTFDQLLRWGAVRDLIPGNARTRRILGGDTLEIRRHLGIERKVTAGAVTKIEIYSFGQKVLEEHGRPLGSDELAQLYPSEFPSNPYELIRWNFDTLAKFWLEFGYIPRASSFSREQLVAIGVRRSIKEAKNEITPAFINQQSKAGLFPSRTPIKRQFGGVPQYRAEVDAEYGRYKKLEGDLLKTGITGAVTRAVCVNGYQPGPEFKKELLAKKEILTKLSHPDASYVLRIIEKGFNLTDEEAFQMQITDVVKYLHKADIQSTAEIAAVFSMIPRFDAAEGLRLL